MSSPASYHRDFTLAQLDLATCLANDFAGPQRKDLELLNKMRKKKAPKAQKSRANAENWEGLAAQGIKKKNLSLNRDWNEKTWTNKASCHERLGYDNIMSDLRVLSETLDESGNFGIHDPAAPAYPPGIYVITDQPRKIILEGQALALTGLLFRLRTPGKGLAYAAKRFFDETGERKAVGRVYELGAGTMKELESVEAELETRDDGCEVWVKWVYTGKTEALKAKMY